MADKETKDTIDALQQEYNDLNEKYEEATNLYKQTVEKYSAIRHSRMETIKNLKEEIKAVQEQINQIEEEGKAFLSLKECNLSASDKVVGLAKDICNLCDPSIKCESEDDLIEAAMKVYEKTSHAEAYRIMEKKMMEHELDKTNNVINQYKHLLCEPSCYPSSNELKHLIAEKEGELKEMLATTKPTGSSSKMSQSVCFIDEETKTFGNKRNKLLELCRSRLLPYGISIYDFNKSWSDGKAFCCLIHSYHPKLLDIEVVKHNGSAKNLLLARELSIKLGLPREDFDFQKLTNKNGTLDFIKIMDLIIKLLTLMEGN